ncbi:MAG: glycerol-3-phosphate dehydrogenase [Pseudohongiellaceae bacterium]
MVLHSGTGSQTVVQAEDTYDLLVVGGGINGAGIAADAAGRGLRVLLCEKGDLGGATSSASTKLIHGGLRYLEYFEIRLVREALAEREVLLGMAPHIVWPMRFRLPHRPGLRPRWMIRIGLWLYDWLGSRNTLPASVTVGPETSGPLRDSLRHAFEYSDCWVDDARLVVLNALLAREHGATIQTRTACTALSAQADGWLATLINQESGAAETVRARAVINATGPWVEQVAEALQPSAPSRPVRLVKGSHIVVPRLYKGSHAYLFQHTDRRVIFVIPYENDFSLIGTTEEECHGDPGQAQASEEEIDYLLEAVSTYFREPVTRAQIRHRFAGVRPLMEEENESATSLSRDYHLQFDRQPAPLLTVYGGKITTYRRLAESALAQLKTVLPAMSQAWTAGAVLPGGDFEEQSRLLADFRARWPWLPEDVVRRWVRSYGTRALKLVGQADSLSDMGRHFGAGLYEQEARYLMEQEWAVTADDILWRRTKIGLHMSEAQRSEFHAWLQEGAPE